MSANIELEPQVKIVVTVAVMVAAIMQMIDTTITNVALPHMQGSLSATQDQLAWVLTSYIVAAAIMTLPIGWLAGRYGQKNVVLCSLAGFTFASLLCGMASSLNEMIMFRIMQGVFGAALVPLSQSIILDINRPEQQTKAMTLWAISVMLGPILGPTLGGFLTESYSWRWVFYINLPLGIAAFIAIIVMMPDSKRVERRFDILGFFTLALSIAGVQLILDRGHQLDWFSSTEIQFYFALILASIWVYITHTRVTNNPFITPAILHDRNFMTAFAFMFICGLVLLATMALMPPYMQTLMGYSVSDTGMILAPRGFGSLIAMVIVGWVGPRIEARNIVFFGLLLTAYSLKVMCTFSTFVPAGLIIENGVLQGLGLGFVFMPLSTVAYVTLKPELRAEAAGLFSLVRNLGSSIGVSIGFVLFARNVQIQHAYLAENITPYSFRYGLHQLPQVQGDGVASALLLLDAEIYKQAATIAYINDFRVMMWVVLAAVPMTLLLRTKAQLAADSTSDIIKV